jgi:cytochrome c553
MKNIIAVIILSVSCIAFISFIHPDQPENEVPYPEGYRNWTHIKTAIIGPQNPGFSSSGGFHHIYANEKAMEGYLTGNFPNGSVIVFDVLEALVQGDGNTYEGNRRHIDVMAKDSIKYSTTKGWGYEEFNADSKVERNATVSIQKNCFNCHGRQKNHVFSTYRK